MIRQMFRRKFDSARACSHFFRADLEGFQPNEEVVGLDFRPADMNLYFVTNQNRIYTITATGTLNLVSTLKCTLEGTTFGVDFNPTVDRLRIISSTQRSLVLNAYMR